MSSVIALTKYHSKDGETKPYGEVDHDTSTLFRLGNSHRLYRRNVVEAAIDAERCSWNAPGRSDDVSSGYSSVSADAKLHSKNCLQMSHHTGLQLIAFPVHTIELTNWMRQPMPVQAM